MKRAETEKQQELQQIDGQLRQLLFARAQLIAERETGEAAASFRIVEELKKEGVRVVYQGVEGAYSHQALRQFFGSDAPAYAVPTFEAAVLAVTSGLADYGVLPVENTTGGSVGDVLDLLMKYDCTTVAELDLPIRHVLLGLPGADLARIDTVYSHPQGLLQCSRFLEEHRDWARIPLGNTAASARRLSEEGRAESAAIASELCGELYGLKTLASGVANDPGNTTRFVIITKEKIFRRDANKIRLCFECPHRTGALFTLLSHFAWQSINLTKIESRPLPGRNFEYRFLVEFEGNLTEKPVQEAIRGVMSDAGFCKVLGNW